MKHYDLKARWFEFVRKTKKCFIHSFFSFYYQIKAILMGVELGSASAFNGHIQIERFKYSTIKIGNHCTFNSHSLFNPRGTKHCILQTATDFAKITIGNNCGFSGVSIVCWNRVTIGDNVMIGADTCIGDTDDHPERLATRTAPVCIGDNVFIGMHCLILKGVAIGEGAVIGAGSIVTKDIPARCVAAGNPCKVIRQL